MTDVRPYQVRDCEVASIDEVRVLRAERDIALRRAAELEQALVSAERERVALRLLIREEADRRERLGDEHAAEVLRQVLGR